MNTRYTRSRTAAQLAAIRGAEPPIKRPMLQVTVTDTHITVALRRRKEED
jgi:hypothetical protein